MTPRPGELEQILVLSQDQARILGHGFIGTEHLLLGLIAEGQGTAAQMLMDFEVTLERVRSKVQEIIKGAGPSNGGPLPQTPRVMKAVEYARLEVVHFDHVSVGSGHLLLGLIKEGEGVAIQVLNGLKVDLARLRAATLSAMGVADKLWPGPHARTATRRRQPILYCRLRSLSISTPVLLTDGSTGRDRQGFVVSDWVAVRDYLSEAVLSEWIRSPTVCATGLLPLREREFPMLHSSRC